MFPVHAAYELTRSTIGLHRATRKHRLTPNKSDGVMMTMMVVVVVIMTMMVVVVVVIMMMMVAVMMLMMVVMMLLGMKNIREIE